MEAQRRGVVFRKCIRYLQLCNKLPQHLATKNNYLNLVSHIMSVGQEFRNGLIG